MGRTAKIRHRRRRSISWQREQVYKRVLTEMCAAGHDVAVEHTGRFKNLVAARLKTTIWSR